MVTATPTSSAITLTTASSVHGETNLAVLVAHTVPQPGAFATVLGEPTPFASTPTRHIAVFVAAATKSLAVPALPLLQKILALVFVEADEALGMFLAFAELTAVDVGGEVNVAPVHDAEGAALGGVVGYSHREDSGGLEGDES